MNTSIFYCRKSTDRDDKQQNSLESQISACMRTIETNHFTLVETFIESASAKKSGKRPIFDSMLALCKKGKIDYIVVDEASRLSRNNTDSAKILGLLEEGHIKGIYTTSQRYFGEQASELFMLLLNFGMAKLDNDTRARNIKSRMITCAEKGRCLGKAPFGYKNVTLLKDGQVSGKGVKIDPIESEIVKEIFQMRGLERMSIPDIAFYLQNKYGREGKHKFTSQGIYKLLKNIFYIGMTQYSGKTYQGSHEAIISTSLFEQVADLERGFYSHAKEEAPEYLYKGILKDEYGIPLTGEVKKGKYKYYRTQNLRSLSRVNMSEKGIIEAIIEKLIGFSIPRKFYPQFIKVAQDISRENTHGNEAQENEIMEEIRTLEAKEKRLLDGYLEGVIENDDYKQGKKSIIEKLTLLKAKKKELQGTKSLDFVKKVKEMFELLENLSERYKNGNYNEKVTIHKKLQFELFVNTKKELTIQGNKLLSNVFFTSFCTSKGNGSATENRTPVYGMKTRCPNH